MRGVKRAHSTAAEAYWRKPIAAVADVLSASEIVGVRRVAVRMRGVKRAHSTAAEAYWRKPIAVAADVLSGSEIVGVKKEQRSLELQSLGRSGWRLGGGVDV